MRTKDVISLGFIDGGMVEGAFCADLVQLSLARREKIDGLLRVSGNLLSRSRNTLVNAFLERTSAAWLLMIDTDQRITPATFDKLLGAAHDKAAPVVSGLCFAAYPPGTLDVYPVPVPAIYDAAPNGQWAPIHNYPRDQLIRIGAAGTGCLLLHRSVLERMRDERPEGLSPAWCWFLDGPVGDDWFSEDLTFMKRLEALDIPVHCHTGAVMPHVKRYTLTDAHHGLWKMEQAHGRDDLRSA